MLVLRPPARPALSTHRDSEISLFGGMPGRGEATLTGGTLGAILQHSFTREGADFDCNVDATGSRFVFASTRHSQNPDLYIKGVSGTAVTQLTVDPASDIQPVFSPDNQRVAFASNRTGNWDIWVVDVHGGRPIQVTDTPMQEVHPSWSPDGSQIVYSALAETTRQWELWITTADENGTSKAIGRGVFPEWSPRLGENVILFQRARQRGDRWFSLWTVELIAGEPQNLTELASSADFALIAPSWSRDGRFIAYTAVEGSSPSDPEFSSSGQTSQIWVIDRSGGTRTRLTDGAGRNFSPAWSPDGRVFFTSTRSGHENIWSVRPSLGASTPSVVEMHGPPIAVPTSSSPNGL